jgi:hypothetical protein
MIQASAVPQFFYVRQDSFGIWPIPQAVYTGKLSYYFRDKNMGVADYSTGTVTVTSGAGSNIITGLGTTWTSSMIGRWFSVTDPTAQGQGYWYRIADYSTPTSLTLSNNWNGPAASGITYNIGETPDIPEELHGILASGTAADYYGGMRKDMVNFEYYNNLFWTGDGQNKSRDIGNNMVAGGLLGAINRYYNRDDRHLIKRRSKLNPLSQKVWATTLS